MGIGDEISLKAEHLFSMGGFPVTNTLLLSFVAVIFFVVFGLSFRSKIKVVPGKFQAFFEWILDEILNLMENVLGSRAAAEKYLSLVASIFFFVLISNWLGILPGLSSVGLKEGNIIVPFFRSPASDLNFTLALAIVSVVATNIIAIRSLGIRIHLKKFFNFQNPIKFFVGILELVSEFAKIVSFSFRLFGNVFAGEVLLITIGALVPYFIPMPFLVMELFVGFIQAFIFAMLTIVFIASATALEEGH
ncbi:F0F1 ATP synthase subunit A [Patescibacteria group bacterium]|jgi:F-type H+-transporting ATPase subunit a|nr:F0F1 ATP synthase subunit A [Patescibacteria group bacterium]MCL5114741.1 F0F1 ATP synthase subunit A [Patescibacteria group bacterium]